jgi:hypothetical protein
MYNKYRIKFGEANRNYKSIGRVAAETYVGLIEQKYENKRVHSLVKKLKINVKMHGEHNVKLMSRCTVNTT